MGKKVFFLFLFCSFLLNAHAPKSIDLSYAGEKATLAVKVWHKVNNPESHYIKKIVVFLGDEQIAEKTYEQQQTGEYQEETFVFNENPLQKGDAVKVRAYCSIFGKKTVDLEWQD
jgi:desulfoferrodoxin (superoxide reductase-like protein)